MNNLKKFNFKKILKLLRKGTFIRFDSIIVGFIARYFYKNFPLFLNSSLCFLLLFFYVIGSDFVISNTGNYSVKYFFVIYLQIISLLILFFFIKIDEISLPLTYAHLENRVVHFEQVYSN